MYIKINASWNYTFALSDFSNCKHRLGKSFFPMDTEKPDH